MSFLLKRLIFNLASLFLIVTATFFLMFWSPGDPFLEEQTSSKEVHESIRQLHGLDDSWFVQYGRHLTSLLQGNFGSSLKYPGRTVNEVIRESFPISAFLGGAALLIAFGGGTVLGCISALYQESRKNLPITLLTILGISIPSFILAILLQYFFALKWGCFPIARWGSPGQVFLPAFSLALAPLCITCKLVKANLVEVFKQDYIRMGHAKGLSPLRIMTYYGLRNALPPLLPYFGQLTANVLVGSFVIEKIFCIPGLGQWFVLSVNDRDYPMIMGLTTFYGILLLAILLVTELAGAYLDPRLAET